MFHSWLMDEDWAWLARALGLVVEVDNLPMTISARPRQPGEYRNSFGAYGHEARAARMAGATHGRRRDAMARRFFDKKKQKAKGPASRVRGTITIAISSIAPAARC